MNTNQLLMKLNEVETENDLLKREIQRLLIKSESSDRLVLQNTESGLKQLLIQIEYQVDNLTNSFDNSLTCSIISSMIDIIWKIFQYETFSLEVKDINHRLREKLNRKLLNSTIASSSENDYICNDESFNDNNKLKNDKSCLLELNYLMQQTTTLKEKLSSQNKLIKSLCETFKQTNSYTPNKSTSDMSVSFLVSSLSMHDNNNQHTAEFTLASTTTTTTTTSQDDEFNDSSLNQTKNDSFNKKTSSNRQHYNCPNCEIQIDKKQVTFEKFEQHVLKCDSNKLVCIFCLEIFDLKQEAEFNQHIQRHLKYSDNNNNNNDYNDANNNMNISNSNNSGSSCSTSSSSNLASTSLSSRSNSNNEINNSTEPTHLTHQQHRQNSKNCLIIQKFEPKIRKRL